MRCAMIVNLFTAMKWGLLGAALVTSLAAQTGHKVSDDPHESKSLDQFYNPYGIAVVSDRGSDNKGTITYTIQKGETLFDIAEKLLGDPYKASMLAKMNGIRDPMHLTAGDKIKVPRPKLSLLYSIQTLVDNK